METKFGRQGFFGMLGENAARKLLKSMGYFVFDAAASCNGRAALLESEIKNIIMPDIIAAHKGPPILVDAKTKTRPSRSIHRNRMEDAIAIRHYESYLAAGRALSMRPAILFIHAMDGEGHIGFLDEVSGDAWRFDPGPHWFESHPGHAFTEPMIFFNVDPNHHSRFTRLLFEKDLTTALQAAAIPPKTVQPWEKRHRHPNRDQGFLPGW